MKADTLDLTKVFVRPVRFLVPMFQRPYVWGREKQWEPLWEDVLDVAGRLLDDTTANDSIPHFLGAIVLAQMPNPMGMLETRSVIDGQQRLTTLQLLIGAARAVALEREMADDVKVLERLVFNDPVLATTAEDRYKVLPTSRDRVAFQAALEGDTAGKPNGNALIGEAFLFFKAAIGEWVDAAADADARLRRMSTLRTVLWSRLLVVVIDLDQQDNEQVIFETMNARGTPLLAADLVKNLLFQTVKEERPVEQQYLDNLYGRWWEPLDSDHWRRLVSQGRLFRPRIDVFLMHWTSMRLAREVVAHELYPDIRRYVKESGKPVEEILADIRTYADVYDSFDAYAHDTPEGRFFYRLRQMETTTAMPVLLWLFGPDGIAHEGERRVAIRAIEGWLVRRMLCQLTTKNYNSIFRNLLIRLKAEQDPPSATVVEYLRGLAATGDYWPPTPEVQASLTGLRAYQVLVRKRLRMILEALEEASRTELGEHVKPGGELTVEHVLPQDWKAHWPLPAGEDPESSAAERETLKHTLGNLTLVTKRLNPAMSNAAWPDKKETLLKHTVLSLSRDILAADEWDHQAIRDRTARLALLATAVWTGPDL